jgi:hypothetical protein
MKKVNLLYLSVFGLLTSSISIHSMDAQAKALAKKENKLFKAERKAILDEINPKKYNNLKGAHCFTVKAFEQNSLDAKRANDKGCVRKKEISQKVVVGSAAWATSRK